MPGDSSTTGQDSRLNYQNPVSRSGATVMNMLGAAFRQFLGLFVDDGSLALEILAVVMLAAISAALIPDVPLVAGAILLFGCLGVLLTNVARAARRR